MRTITAFDEESVQSLQFTHDSKRVLVANGQCEFELYRIDDLAEIQSFNIKGFHLNFVAVSPVDDTIAILVEYDIPPTGGMIRDFRCALEVIRLDAPESRRRMLDSPEKPNAPQFSHDGKWLSVWDRAVKKIKVWKTADWSLKSELPSGDENYVIDATDQTCLISERLKCRVVGLTSGTEIRSWEIPEGVNQPDIHPNGDIMIVGEHHHILQGFKATTLSTFSHTGEKKKIVRISNRIAKTTISQDGQCIVVNDRKGLPYSNGVNKLEIQIWRWNELIK